MSPKRATIRGYITRVVSVGDEVGHSSEAEVLKVATLHFSFITIRDSLVGQFMSHFRLLMEVSPTIRIILARVVVSL